MTNEQTKQEQPTKQKISINPNPTYISLTHEEELNADLEQSRIQIETLKQERDAIAGTVNRLDRELAQQKDETAKQQQINQALLKTFNDLLTMHSQLYDQMITSNTALTITAGKLAESLVKFKFTLPQQEQQSP